MRDGCPLYIFCRKAQSLVTGTAVAPERILIRDANVYFHDDLQLLPGVGRREDVPKDCAARRRDIPVMASVA